MLELQAKKRSEVRLKREELTNIGRGDSEYGGSPPQMRSPRDGGYASAKPQRQKMDLKQIRREAKAQLELAS